MSDDRIKKMIEHRLDREGYTAKSWKEDTDDGLTASLGQFKVVEEIEEKGLYMDDEGELTACVVGAPEYNNERVYLSFTPEDQDGGYEVESFDLACLDPIDS